MGKTMFCHSVILLLVSNYNKRNFLDVSKIELFPVNFLHHIKHPCGELACELWIIKYNKCAISWRLSGIRSQDKSNISSHVKKTIKLCCCIISVLHVIIEDCQDIFLFFKLAFQQIYGRGTSMPWRWERSGREASRLSPTFRR